MFVRESFAFHFNELLEHYSELSLCLSFSNCVDERRAYLDFFITQWICIEQLNGFSFEKKIYHSFELIWTHDFLNPKIFDYSLWQTDFDIIINLLQGNTFEDNSTLKRIQGIQKFLKENCQQDKEKIKQKISEKKYIE